ncbi:MAG: ribosome biogenesis factor YjgA, partial [Gammaproteobacteria bacterium]
MSRSDDDAPSKTRRKREAAALQALGEELATLPADVLATLGLPDRLQQALEDLSTIPSHEAQRRHRQFIGRLMRDIDPEPLQKFMDDRRRPTRTAARLFRIAEHWRDRLIDEGDAALQAFLSGYPETDAAALEETLAAARQ